MKTFSAKNFSNKPEPVYRAADREGEVKINHDRYKDKIFILTARERNPINMEKENEKD